MKSLFYLTLLLGSTTLYAQNFPQQLGQALGQFAQAQSAEDLGNSAATFSELSKVEGASWHASYYASLATVFQSFRTEGQEDRDRLVSEAQTALDAAVSAGADAIEATALQARIYQARISVDPNNRSMQYGPKTMGILFPAKAKAPGNPRVLMLLAQMVARTPATYGGGPDKALPLVQASIVAYEEWSSDDPFAPSWGEDEAINMLSQLKSAATKSKKK